MSFHKATFYRETYTAPLSHIERAIAGLLAEEGPMTSLELSRRLKHINSYDQGLTSIRVHVHRLRTRLEPLGWSVTRNVGGSRSFGSGANAYAVYELRRIADAVE